MCGAFQKLKIVTVANTKDFGGIKEDLLTSVTAGELVTSVFSTILAT